MEEFKKGDIVQHKTGGPKMVVIDPHHMGLINRGVLCEWFNIHEGRTENHIFEPKALILD